MSQAKDLFKKIRDAKVAFHANICTIQDRNSNNLTEAEEIKKRWQKYTDLYKKNLNDLANHDGGYPGV